MSECTHDCSSCGESCASREPQSLLKAHHADAHVGKVYGIVSVLFYKQHGFLLNIVRFSVQEVLQLLAAGGMARRRGMLRITRFHLR